MQKRSAGILLYRITGTLPEVLLVHPGGPFFARKDAGVWSVPKGEIEEGEDAELAAIREFEEETGNKVSGKLLRMNPVLQKNNKLVEAFAVRMDLVAENIKSNMFEMEWPPKSGVRQQFPEVDRASWFNFADARGKIIPAQSRFLDELEKMIL